MKSSQIKRLLQGAPSIREFELRGKLLYKPPVGHILVGLYFNDSGFSSDVFYVICFAQPMFVPSESISFVFSKELRPRGMTWTLQQATAQEELLEKIEREALPAIADLETLELFQKNCMRYASATNPHAAQALAYSYILSGYVDAALEHISLALRLADQVGGKPEWSKAVASELKRIERLVTEDFEGARRTLLETEGVNKRLLGVL